MNHFYNAKQEVVEKPPEADIQWRISVYPIVFNDNGEVLVVQSAISNRYEFPGGGVELHETLAQALSRECYEETGYTVSIGSNVPVYSGEQFFYESLAKKYYHSMYLLFEAHLDSDEQNMSAINPEDIKETESVEWVSLDMLHKENCHAIHFPAVEILKARK